MNYSSTLLLDSIGLEIDCVEYCFDIDGDIESINLPSGRDILPFVAVDNTEVNAQIEIVRELAIESAKYDAAWEAANM